MRRQEWMIPLQAPHLLLNRLKSGCLSANDTEAVCCNFFSSKNWCCFRNTLKLFPPSFLMMYSTSLSNSVSITLRLSLFISRFSIYLVVFRCVWYRWCPRQRSKRRFPTRNLQKHLWSQSFVFVYTNNVCGNSFDYLFRKNKSIFMIFTCICQIKALNHSNR